MIHTKEFYLELLQKEYPEVYNAMKETEHGYNGTEPNPYHLEGTVLKHTEMVLTEVEKRYASNPELMLTALLHDIGKPSCAEDIHDKKRRRFINHEAVSTFMAKPILQKFKNHITFNTAAVLTAISLHGRLYNFMTDNGIPREHWDTIRSMFGTNEELFEVVIAFLECDHYGRTKEGPDTILRVLQDLDAIYEGNEVAPTLTLLVGPPRSGKSTWVKANQGDAVVISRDSYVETFGRGLTYSDKWNSLPPKEHKFIDIDLQLVFNRTTSLRKDIIIDMTNMSKKSRKKWLVAAKEYKTKAVVFIEDLDTLLSRNTPDKTIGENIIKSMQRNFVMPTYDEFDTIELH